MHRLTRRLSALRARRRRDERGAVAIIVAVSMTAVLLCAGLVLDFGLIRIDRQADKSAADSAALAGLQALAGSDRQAHPYAGVCTALQYLKTNGARFAGIDTSTGWSNGAGAATGSGCTDATLRARACAPGNQSSWAVFSWSGTWQGTALSVRIQSGYSLVGTGWKEDDLPASVADSDDSAQGCDQLAVVITEHRNAGFGRLAGVDDLATSVRSVGRVEIRPGGVAPALLLLKRSGCPVLETGSTSGGSFIHVLGALSSDGHSGPGTIHSDSDGSGCSGSVFSGRAPDGIVAYAAPQVGNPSAPDAGKPGSITSVAALTAGGTTTVRDGLANVYAATSLNAAAGPGTRVEATGMALITRKYVDQRYFGAASGPSGPTGVKGAIVAANGVFGSGAAGPPSGYVRLSSAAANDCKPTQAEIDSLHLTAASRLYVGCSGKFVGGGSLTIPAGTVYFHGSIDPAGVLQLPNADHVYVESSSGGSAINLNGGTAFEVNNAPANIAGGQCAEGQSSSRAVVFLRTGGINMPAAGTKLQLCRTTLVMMGGSSTGCVPAATGTAPTASPCSGPGTGAITQNGGAIDWTAPDRDDIMTLPDGTDDPMKAPDWTDVNGLEDLAFWSESAGSYSLAGGSALHVRGVFMVPNAAPFRIGGGASMSLTNAQFIVSSIALNGTGTNITMSVDPNSAVTTGQLVPLGLVR